jgi:hypothetical protein
MKTYCRRVFESKNITEILRNIFKQCRGLWQQKLGDAEGENNFAKSEKSFGKKRFLIDTLFGVNERPWCSQRLKGILG